MICLTLHCVSKNSGPLCMICSNNSNKSRPILIIFAIGTKYRHLIFIYWLLQSCDMWLNREPAEVFTERSLAERSIAEASCPSVRLSVTLRYRDHIQCKSKNPSEDLWQFFKNGWEFFNQILHAYYAFQSTLVYKFVCNYLQLWWSYAILSATTQFTSCAQYVHHRLKRTLASSDFFPKQLGIFSPNFTHLLNVHTYARMQIYIQLSPTLTKLCHIKCNYPACVSVDGGHFEYIMVVALNMA